MCRIVHDASEIKRLAEAINSLAFVVAETITKRDRGLEVEESTDTKLGIPYVTLLRELEELLLKVPEAEEPIFGNADSAEANHRLEEGEVGVRVGGPRKRGVRSGSVSWRRQPRAGSVARPFRRECVELCSGGVCGFGRFRRGRGRRF
jgi:hypothetical protein